MHIEVASYVRQFEKLELIQRLLIEVRDTLNNERHQCECCGLTVYKSEKEWVQRQMLEAALKRVERVAAEMKRT